MRAFTDGIYMVTRTQALAVYRLSVRNACASKVRSSSGVGHAARGKDEQAGKPEALQTWLLKGPANGSREVPTTGNMLRLCVCRQAGS